MSIGVSTGVSLTTNEILTAAKLNAMYNNAAIAGMVSPDMQPGYHLIDIAVAEPTPTNGRPWLDAEGYLRYGTGAHHQHGSGILRMTFGGAGTCTAGSVVVVNPAAADSVILCGTDSAASTDARVFGVALADVVAAATGYFMYRGICPVNLSLAQVSGVYLGRELGGSFISARGTDAPGTARVDAPPLSGQSQPMALFGVLLENFTSSTFVAGNHYCKIWK